MQDALMQNLKDAGCPPELIDRFVICQDAGKTRDALRVLAAHRAVLLDEMHASQDKLDCLDYLIFQLRKERCDKR